MKTPSLLIVTDYHQLCAYLVEPDGSPEIVERRDFQHDGQTGVPLVEWTPDRNGYLTLVAEIGAILERYNPGAWAMACPGPLADILPSLLSADHAKRLATCKRLDVGNIDISNVGAVFGGAG
jgi:hypothetical protein